MTALLGIDCATIPRRTGVALGELRGGKVHILRWSTGTPSRPTAEIALEWLQGYERAVIALDAPLGWPRGFGSALSGHRAGLPLGVGGDRFFRRDTDLEIKKRLGKLPLEVTANFIARTAVKALELLSEIREKSGRPVPLAWASEETEPWRSIEVYPAATRIAHAANKKERILEDLSNVLDCSEVLPEIKSSEHAVDAAVCALAGGDFLLGRAIGPSDEEMAAIEGWIWAPKRQEYAGNSHPKKGDKNGGRRGTAQGGVQRLQGHEHGV